MKTKHTFESALTRLEEIADKLEEGNIPLDESIALFEEGIELSKYCDKKLNTAEQKIETVNSFDLPEEFKEPEKKKNKSKKSIADILDDGEEDNEDSFLF